ncbi:hypothetical protein [Streptomyces griseoaurantiacus]|uniref:hypothetical protein n=1 Tax=Streptomyces griseoaurantiacus TaxID=68213 RepID=UPI0036C01546
MQLFGLEMLILADGWEAGELREADFQERLKLALVAAGREPMALWPVSAPQAAPGPVEDVVEDLPEVDADADFDYSAVAWQDGSADDWELMQQALASSRVEVAGEQTVEAPDAPEVPDVDFDREWQ